MISAVLLFDDEADNETLIDVSRQINEQYPSLIKLDQHFLPHITLAQFNASNEVAEELWNDIRHCTDLVDELISGGLNFAPSTPDHQMWIELQFLKSNALAQLQTEILSSNTASKQKLHNGGGDNFRPHCTLALLSDMLIPKLEFNDLGIFKRKFSNLKLAVGLNGENFTFIEAKFS